MTKTKLSPIVAGTMNWGIWDKNLSVKEMGQMIPLCLENNITTFDHADIYGAYTTEADFGKAFAASKIAREKMQLISKCGIQLVSDNRKNSVKHYDYSLLTVFLILSTIGIKICLQNTKYLKNCL
jgi:predicted oxidoreductase